MKRLLILILCLFSIFAYANDYPSLDGDMLYDQTSDPWAAVNFVPTYEMKSAVAAIKDPSERMLNHTFWQEATVEEVQKLLHIGVDLNAKTNITKYGLRILDFAIFSGKEELVWAVLNASPNTNYRSGGNIDGYQASGYSPLMLAIIIFPNDIAMMKRIVSLGCDPNMTSDYSSALHIAQLVIPELGVQKASQEVYQYIFKITSPSLRLHTKSFWEAATAEMVQQEIKNGADVNYALFWRGYSYTPLWYAVQYGNHASIQALINAGGTFYQNEKIYPAAFDDAHIYYNAELRTLLTKNKVDLSHWPDMSFAIVIDTTGLNIRKEANAHSAIVGEPLPEGSIVEITGDEQGNWVPISYQGRSGFVYKTLIEPYIH